MFDWVYLNYEATKGLVHTTEPLMQEELVLVYSLARKTSVAKKVDPFAAPVRGEDSISPGAIRTRYWLKPMGK